MSKEALKEYFYRYSDDELREIIERGQFAQKELDRREREKPFSLTFIVGAMGVIMLGIFLLTL